MVPPHVDSTKIVHHAYHRYNLSLGIGLSKVAGRVFRIGHLGALNELMVLTALAGAEMALQDFGADIQLGSGVGAAQGYLCRRPDRASAPPPEFGPRGDRRPAQRARRCSTGARGRPRSRACAQPFLSLSRSNTISGSAGASSQPLPWISASSWPASQPA